MAEYIDKQKTIRAIKTFGHKEIDKGNNVVDVVVGIVTAIEEVKTTNYTELHCNVGDDVYYIKPWDKHSYQTDNQSKVSVIRIHSDRTVYITDNGMHLFDKDYGKTWFTHRDKWEQAITEIK